MSASALQQLLWFVEQVDPVEQQAGVRFAPLR